MNWRGLNSVCYLSLRSLQRFGRQQPPLHYEMEKGHVSIRRGVSWSPGGGRKFQTTQETQDTSNISSNAPWEKCGFQGTQTTCPETKQSCRKTSKCGLSCVCASVCVCVCVCFVGLYRVLFRYLFSWIIFKKHTHSTSMPHTPIDRYGSYQLYTHT